MITLAVNIKGIIPRKFEIHFLLGCILFSIEHELPHLLTLAIEAMAGGFLVNKVAIIAIVFGYVNQLAREREGVRAFLIFLQEFQETFAVGTTRGPVEEEGPIDWHPIAVASINDIRAWH